MSGVIWEIRPDLDGGVATAHSAGVLHEVWWDTQDAGNPGYAYRTSGDLVNESGPLDAKSLTEAITEYEEANCTEVTLIDYDLEGEYELLLRPTEEEER